MKNTLYKTSTFVINSVRYNLKIIFANRFVYFLLASVIIFLLITVINLFSEESDPSPALAYYWLMVPGLLLMFYPSVFGIQNDVDSGMLELLFGIPNYRYKVWLVRLVVMYIVVFVLLAVLALLTAFALTPFHVLSMVYQLMFPIFFLGCVSFMLSTLIRNGYGTAVVMVIIGLFFWIMSGALSQSKWNIFLNPFQSPGELSDIVWATVIAKNRLYLVIGTLVSILFALFNLQKREKFI